MSLVIPSPAKLSPRESRVIHGILSGLSAPQIAKRQRIKPKTVYTYRYRAFEKLGISSGSELFQWYGHALHAKHGDLIPAVAILQPGIDHLQEAA